MLRSVLVARLSTFPRLLSTSALSSKIYEFRTYDVQPSKMRECVGIMEELVAVRVKHSKLTGAWFTELGALNEVNFIWEYDNFTHRTAVRKKLAGDHQWQNECLPRLLPLLKSQTNSLLQPFQTEFYQPKLEPAKGYGVYMLYRAAVKPGMVDEYACVLKEKILVPINGATWPMPIGVWFTDLGPYSSALLLLRHASFEAREEFVASLRDSSSLAELGKAFNDSNLLTNEVTVKAMIPATFSPLQ